MNMIFSIILAFIHVLTISSFNVQQADFTLPKKGQQLKGKEIKTRLTKSTFFCANDCVRLEECAAYNYYETNGTCQLMATNDLSKAEPNPNSQIVLKKVRLCTFILKFYLNTYTSIYLFFLHSFLSCHFL